MSLRPRGLVVVLFTTVLVSRAAGFEAPTPRAMEAESVAEVGRQMVHAGFRSAGRDCFREALATIRPADATAGKSQTLAEIAVAAAEVGLDGLARKAASRAIPVAEQLPTKHLPRSFGVPVKEWKGEVLHSIAETLTAASLRTSAADAIQAAKKAAEGRTSAWWKAELLARTANLLAGRGETEAARRLFRKARSIAEGISTPLPVVFNSLVSRLPGPLGRRVSAKYAALNEGMALTTVGEEMAAAGFREAASDVFAAVEALAPWTPNPSQLYGELARSMAQAGMAEEAYRVLERYADAISSASVAARTARALAKAGRVRKARKAAGLLQARDSRPAALRTVTEVLAEAGRFDRASRVAGRIGVDAYRAHALARLASRLVEAGREGAAERTVRKVRTLAEGSRWWRSGREDTDVGTATPRDHVWSSAVSKATDVLARLGRLSEALSLVADAGSSSVVSAGLRRLAAARLAREGHFQKARRVVDDDTGPFRGSARAKPLAAIARSLAEHGRREKSLETFMEAKDAARAIHTGELFPAGDESTD